MTTSKAAALAEKVVAAATTRGYTITTAESCTGGLISAALTDVPGASTVFTHGFVTYANEAKSALLGVDPKLLTRMGAVSGSVALAMAKGARREAGADFAVSVTGIAGPGGGTIAKPVGLVFIGIADPRGAVFHRHRFPARGRQVIRRMTVEAALAHLSARLMA